MLGRPPSNFETVKCPFSSEDWWMCRTQLLSWRIPMFSVPPWEIKPFNFGLIQGASMVFFTAKKIRRCFVLGVGWFLRIRASPPWSHRWPSKVTRKPYSFNNWGPSGEVDEVTKIMENFTWNVQQTRKLVYIKRRFKVSRLGIFEASIIFLLGGGC